MTLLDAPPASATAPVPARRRPLRAAGIVLAVVALLAGGIVGGIAIRDAVLLSQVHVFLGAEPISCADPSDVTTVARGDDGSEDEQFAVPSVRGRADLVCTLSVVVQNRSDTDVDVQRIAFTLLGPSSEVGLRSNYSFTQGLRPIGGPQAVDAVFDYEHEAPIGVRANGVRIFRFRLVSDGCRQQGATTTFDVSPVVTTTAGLVTQDVDRQGVGFGFVGAKTAVQSCR